MFGCVRNSRMAANTAIGCNGAGRSCGRMMKKRSVTTDAIGLDDREVVWLDANIFRVVTEREGLRVMPAIGANAKIGFLVFCQKFLDINLKP